VGGLRSRCSTATTTSGTPRRWRTSRSPATPCGSSYRAATRRHAAVSTCWSGPRPTRRRGPRSTPAGSPSRSGTSTRR
jgi:hypothetical protein